MANGAATTEAVGATRTAAAPDLNWFLIAQFIMLAAVMAVASHLSFVVVPSIREAAATIHEERARDDARRQDEIKRMETIDALRKRQTINEALLLAEQERNLKLARELQDRLRSLKGN